MLWAVITAAAFCVCASKYITKRLCGEKTDKLFLRLHLAGGILLPVGAGIHAAAMLGGGKRRSPVAVLFGAACGLGIALLMLSHFFAKKLGDYAMPLHRAATCMTGAGMALHALTGAK